MECLLTYLKHTESHRGDNPKSKTFLGFQRPYASVTASTLSRWLSDVMRDAGIDVSLRPHGTRSGSTSKAAAKVPIDCVLSAAGWTCASTFASFYNRPISCTTSFSDAVLG